MATTIDNMPVQNEQNTDIDINDLKKLLGSLKAKVVDLKVHMRPLIEKLNNGQLQTNKGVSFLEAKYQIMLQYILQLTYFVHCKLSGKQIKGHPVVESLVELRVVLERMKPIEAKLKYQIDKLVRTAVLGTQQEKEQTANDPLAFKPNPTNLLNKEEDEEDEDDEDDDDEMNNYTKGNKSNGGIYRPPKMAPVTYDETGGSKKSKQEKNEERLKEKASRSRLMKDLMTEMNDAPEELDALGGVNEGTGYGERMDRKMAEKNDYEENNYVRLQVTRKEKKHLMAKNKMRFESEFDNLNDFSNLVGIQEVDERENERFRNVLNRKSQHKDKRGHKRPGKFHGVVDGEGASRNKFQRNVSFSKKRQGNQ
ncbi:Sas10/Utp3/C1D family-domain-containing protein [Halteromyces radiatus]|uniref:Sas10/Utp3/C1D family-domain-containing protein n=1 Tax=Halteromyces radiatus TaxID=101107 RepID=UPI00221F6F60|nr:Sas10/Utp3/C1D family-domain-containing protein [Halteromyces radiatus]KAI8078892.1 Sas10/Utp3/C1D family-domain-containing protein [Halteromyces radiatus]